MIYVGLKLSPWPQLPRQLRVPFYAYIYERAAASASLYTTQPGNCRAICLRPSVNWILRSGCSRLSWCTGWVVHCNLVERRRREETSIQFGFPRSASARVLLHLTKIENIESWCVIGQWFESNIWFSNRLVLSC